MKNVQRKRFTIDIVSNNWKWCKHVKFTAIIENEQFVLIDELGVNCTLNLLSYLSMITIQLMKLIHLFHQCGAYH